MSITIDKTIEVNDMTLVEKPMTYGEIDTVSWGKGNLNTTVSIVFWESLEKKNAGEPRLYQISHIIFDAGYLTLEEIEADVVANIDLLVQ